MSGCHDPRGSSIAKEAEEEEEEENKIRKQSLREIHHWLSISGPLQGMERLTTEQCVTREGEKSSADCQCPASV